MTNIKKLAELARLNGHSPMLHENHKSPLTRRDLLSQGFMGGFGLVFTPSILAALSSSRAYGQAAAGCGGGGAGGESPMNGMRVMAFEGAGGMNIAGSNFMVWGQGGKGDYLPARALNVLGVPTTQAVPDQVSIEFGIPMHSNSAFLEGLRAATTPEVRERCNGFPICTTSMDDSNANPFSLAYYLYKSGAIGTLTSLIGTDTSPHGARSPAPSESVVSGTSATVVRSYEDARNLVSAASLETVLPDEVSNILAAATKMSETRLGMLADTQLPEQMRTLIKCGYAKSADAVKGGLADKIDASKNTELAAALAATATNVNPRAFQVDRNLNSASNQETLSLAYLLLKGYAGFATKVVGGCDYHNNPRQNTNQKDFDIGYHVGMAFQAAHHMGKSMVCMLYTDGGVGCSDANTPDNPNSMTDRAGGQAMFTGDRGEGSAIIVMAYHPTRAPEVVNPRQQVNAFNPNGGVDQNYADGKIVANSVTNAVQCAVLNILALHGKLADAEKVLGASHPFKDPAVLAKYVIFGGWPA